jgi:hypothetical protein
MFGAGVSFVFFSGCYIQMRKSLMTSRLDESDQPQPKVVNLRVLNSKDELSA